MLQRSSHASRQRRYKARQRQGDVVITVTLSPDETATLNRVGCLDLDKLEDRAAIADAWTQVAYAFFAALAPLSAGAQVLQRALGVSFDGAASISIPMIAPGIAGFVPEAGPIPVRSFPSTAATIAPRKLACLVELS